MTLGQFIAAYLIITMLFPIIDKISEILVNLAQIIISHIALTLHKIQAKIQKVAGGDGQDTRVIGFRSSNSESEEDEEYE